MLKLKLNTEYALGCACIVLNMWGVAMGFVLFAMGHVTGIFYVYHIVACGFVWLITLVSLFNLWADKFNYLED